MIIALYSETKKQNFVSLSLSFVQTPVNFHNHAQIVRVCISLTDLTLVLTNTTQAWAGIRHSGIVFFQSKLEKCLMVSSLITEQ